VNYPKKKIAAKKKSASKKIKKALVSKSKPTKGIDPPKLKELLIRNKELQKEINLNKKHALKLEEESMLLTKKLMEAGYKPKL
jgi:hypothetical protein